MRNLKLHLAAISILGAAFLGGCTLHGDVGPEPAGYTVVEPGYYYDEAYVDVYGHPHPRAYYYYNGHSWAHRDYVPHGYVAHARVHARAEHHEEVHHQEVR